MGGPGPGGEDAGLYLHFPYCRARCPYCDFAVRVARPAERTAFIDRIAAEAALWGDWAHPIDTCYLGGGTPSMIEPGDLERLLAALREHLPLRPGARIYLEANPEDLSAERLAAWGELGVGTLSLGVQSFVDAELRRLGRGHRAAGARAAVRAALEAGLETVSVDLIFGLPGQRPEDWEESLAAVLELGPQHLSCYQLAVHEATTYGRWRERGRLVELPESEQARLYALTHEVLGAAGWQAYEVSSFARGAAHRSRHNLKYWHHVPYLGLGPSAHSFAGRRRWWNLGEPAAYAARVGAGRRPVAGGERLGPRELALEALMLGLRLAAGIDLATYRARFGVDLAACNRELIADLAGRGLLVLEAGRLAPSARGMAVADALAARFDLGALEEPLPAAVMEEEIT